MRLTKPFSFRHHLPCVVRGYPCILLPPLQVNWGMWGLPKMVCDFYIALDVVCSTSSIFNLVAISIDR